jgi:hypothetical protein
MPNGAANRSSSNRIHFPGSELNLTTNGHELTRIEEKTKTNRRWTQIYADKLVAPFKSGKFGQGWALDCAIAHAISLKR